MNVLEIWLTGAAVAVAGCCAAVAFSMFKRREGNDLASRALKLASEIVEVAETIDEDVADVRDEPRFTRIAQRCRECTERARETLQTRQKLRPADRDTLTATLLLLHEDHRRIVDLRLDADRTLVARAEREQEGNWASRFASTLASNWSSSLSTARPSSS